jgi:hypothetical protein
VHLLIVAAPHGYCKMNDLIELLPDFLPEGYQSIVVPYKADAEHRDFRFFVIPSADTVQVPCEVLPAGFADNMTAFLKEKGLLK